MTLRTKLEILASLIFLVVVWHLATPKRDAVGMTTIAATAPELKGIDKQDIIPPKVPVYTQPAKQKLQLPLAVQDDQNKYVLASSKLPNDTHTHTVTTVIDQQTGAVQTYDRRDPYPWLAAEQNGSLWMGYGIKNGGSRVGIVMVTEELAQVKALHLGAAASVSTDGGVFAGLGVAYRW